jgi:hypothetical protein
MAADPSGVLNILPNLVNRDNPDWKGILMYRLPAVMFPALFFVIPAISLAQTTPVWFTLNAQEGQTITATRSITHRFGQVASICAFAESTGPCRAGADAPSLEAWPSPKIFDDTSSGVKFASLLFQPQFRSVRMWACSDIRVMPRHVRLEKNFCFISCFHNHRPILRGFPDQLVA